MSRIPRCNVSDNTKISPPLTSSTPMENFKKISSTLKADLSHLKFINNTSELSLIDNSMKSIAKPTPKGEPLKPKNTNAQLKRAASSTLPNIPRKQVKVVSKSNNTAAKIPPYDYKARYNDVFEKYTNLKSEHGTLKETHNIYLDQTEKIQDSLASYECRNAELAKEVEQLKTENQKYKFDLEKVGNDGETQTKKNVELDKLLNEKETRLISLLRENSEISSQFSETSCKLTLKSNEYNCLKDILDKEIKKALELTSAVEEYQIKVSTYSSEITFLKAKQNIVEQKNNENNALISELKQENDRLKDRVSSLEIQVKSLENDLCSKTEDCNKFTNLYDSEKSTSTGLNSELNCKRAEASELLSKFNNMKKDKEYLDMKNEEYCNEISRLNRKNEELQKNVESMYENQKSLRNNIQDLKGHIRVYCRVRPVLSQETAKAALNVDIVDSCTMEVEKMQVNSTSGLAKKQNMKHSFAFDGVFPSQASQSEIFEEVSSLVQSALDGYNVCIFAYGQTGSGKTYTMEGDVGTDSFGIVPRAIDMIFDSVPSLKQMGWEFKITASFLEIYNENIYDLLDPNKDQAEHCIKMSDSKGVDVYVSNLKEELVNNSQELNRLLMISQRNRQTAATSCNERSSRSHSITKIKIDAVHEKRREKYASCLNLVDLAGSESGKTSQRMDETKSINKSLSELSKVILALQAKQTHVPYRNSKLTYLLMPSLGGNSKTLMLVNVSQLDECYNETLNSLRFAAKVNSCRNGVSKKNISSI